MSLLLYSVRQLKKSIRIHTTDKRIYHIAPKAAYCQLIPGAIFLPRENNVKGLSFGSIACVRYDIFCTSKINFLFWAFFYFKPLRIKTILIWCEHSQKFDVVIRRYHNWSRNENHLACYKNKLRYDYDVKTFESPLFQLGFII